MQGLQTFELQPGVRVLFGVNSIDEIGRLVGEFGARRVLLVTDAGIAKAGHIARVVHALGPLEVFIFDNVEENPSTRHVDQGLQFANEHRSIDLIVALGGGSAMDCAKGINFLLTNGGRMEDYWGSDKALKEMLPSIGIPTTAGTGSEAQSYALIEQEGTHIKMACGDPKARFRAVILDPGLTTTMPRSVTAITGIDAVTHSVESYVTTRRNPTSEKYAKEAWRLLEQNYETVLMEPENVEARANMLLASHFAGTAIEYSMLGAAHACANPLSARFGVAHGVAVGLMIPHVIRFNAPVVNNLYLELLQAAGVGSKAERTGAETLCDRILEMKQHGSLPARLRDCGVMENAIPDLAKEAAKQWTGTFNPRPVNEQDFIQLYEAAY